MTRPSQLLFGAALAVLLSGPSPARATDAAPLPAAAADPAACADDKNKDAERAKRQAALDELGRRLAADHQQQEAEDSGMHLNRTGHNYGPYTPDEAPQPPASAPPSDSKRKPH
jgi:hypothetical protein